MRSATFLTLALLCASCGPSQPKYDAATEDCIHRHRKMEENAMQGASEAQKETIRILRDATTPSLVRASY